MTTREKIIRMADEYATFSSSSGDAYTFNLDDLPKFVAAVIAEHEREKAGAQAGNSAAEHWNRLYREKCQELHDERARLGAEVEGIEAGAQALREAAEKLNDEVTRLRRALEKCELFKLQPDTVQQIVNAALRGQGGRQKE